MTIPEGSELYLTEVGYNDMHYPADIFIRTKQDLELPVITGPKIWKSSQYQPLLLPKSVVINLKLSSAIAWIKI